MTFDAHGHIRRTAFFRFYEELNDFLPLAQHKITFAYTFTGKPAIKDTIEAIGVPHTEIDLILVDGQSKDFSYQMQGGEQVAVYPGFVKGEAFDISELVRLRPNPLRETKFVVDVNLGKLAKKLRLLGFDTLFRNDYKDDEIVDISLKEKRIILTRDKGVLKYHLVSHGYWLRSDNPKEQVKEVVNRLQLAKNFNPFSRCPACNGLLQQVAGALLLGRLPSDTLADFDVFKECTACHKLYWQGSHYDRICRWLDDLSSS